MSVDRNLHLHYTIGYGYEKKFRRGGHRYGKNVCKPNYANLAWKHIPWKSPIFRVVRWLVLVKRGRKLKAKGFQRGGHGYGKNVRHNRPRLREKFK